MSELKSFIVLYDGKFIRAYKESEADKVIAELKECVKGLILDNYLKDKELRHHKYKRCLAMANRCRDKLEAMKAVYYDDQTKAMKLYNKWFGRYCKFKDLAYKFKEAK